MATAVKDLSKNAKRIGSDILLCRCGKKIEMHTVFEAGKLRHFAKCLGCGKTARRPKDLM